MSRVILGDSNEKLKSIEDNSIDLVCTDPPYFMINKSGDGFMGKKWDSININDSFNILCRSKKIVQSVIRFIMSMKVELNMEEVNIAPASANMKQENEQIQKLNVNVPSAKKNFTEQKVISKVNSNSVQGIVLIKEEVLAMLKELSPHPMIAIENLPANVSFVIPIFYIMDILTKNIVLRDVLKLPTEKICEGRKIPLGLMDGQRIVGVIEGMTGKLLENESIEEIIGHANHVRNIVEDMKFKRIILSNTNLQKIIQWITLLLFVIDVTPRSKMGFSHALVQQFHRNWAKECFRVMKPGSFMFAMNSPRSDCMEDMISSFTDVGFDTNFSFISWNYNSGFPKAGDTAKLIDERFFNEWFKVHYKDEIIENNQKKKAIKNSGLSKTDLDEQLQNLKIKWDVFRDSKKSEWSMEVYGKEIETFIYEHPGRKNRSYQTTSNIFSGDRQNDKIEQPVWEAHRNTKHTRQNPYQGGKNLLGKKEDIIKGLHLKNPISPEAIKFHGSKLGHQMKPAFEVIIVVMKPLDQKTYIDQALSNGKGISWIDDCRIPYSELSEYIDNNRKGYCGNGGTGVLSWNKGKQTSCKDSKKPPQSREAFLNSPEGQNLKKHLVGGRLKQEKRWTYGDEKVDGFTSQEFEDVEINLDGRYPANLLVSDDILGLELSRFFSLDAWWEQQIGTNITKLPKEQQKTFPFLFVPKASKTEKNKGLDDFPVKTVENLRSNAGPALVGENREGRTQMKNTHPTVKPIKLMEYLVTLGSRQGDLVLDPFAGSGPTLIACHRLHRAFIGIEFERESYEILKARLKFEQKQKKLI